MSLASAALATTLTAGQTAPAPVQNIQMKAADGKVLGTASVTPTPKGVLIRATFEGVSAGPHGFHIHETGKCEPPEFTTAGGHFNPTKAAHGFLDPKGAHAGDMPNVFVAQGQKLEVEVLAPGVTLDSGATGLRDADGSSLVLHA
ncbi:MAG TPA: superoxide dismutase family protein, partial [Vicinamibacterales bacterium]|nr:superoxide dismutase family protein [Vicinamibacterales bacterium]